ncbi:head-tail adaptor protein [Clostridium sp. Mt-5]|uniref:Head-tail adaptor protein n=1 Tax=Clostridium moutaii TaxID=3240932 RepID=A0ABV4BS55_9CLOT
MNAGQFNKKIEVWGKIPFQNEVHAKSFKNSKIKTIWASIVPQTGSLAKQKNADTLLANVTHKIIIRYNSGKNIVDDMWLMYFTNDTDREAYLNDQTLKVGHRFDISYILDPFYKHETLEIYCVESLE